MTYNPVKEVKELAETLSCEWNLPIKDFYTEEVEYIGMIVQINNDDVKGILGLTF